MQNERVKKIQIRREQIYLQMRFHTIHSIYVENANSVLAAQAFPETETKSVTYYFLHLNDIVIHEFSPNIVAFLVGVENMEYCIQELTLASLFIETRLLWLSMSYFYTFYNYDNICNKIEQNKD